MLATLDKFGRVLIPKKVRDQLGIKATSSLNITDDGKRIIIEPLRENEALIKKEGILVFTGKMRIDSEAELTNDRDERSNRLLFPEK